MIKKIGNSLYVHKSNIQELFQKISPSAKQYIESIIKLHSVSYEIIKFNNSSNSKEYSISFIQCSQWNKVWEPLVEDSYHYDNNGLCHKIKGGNKVYHHKHMFVSKDYKDFNILESIERSKMLLSIEEIQKNKKQIGNYNYWKEIIDKYNL